MRGAPQIGETPLATGGDGPGLLMTPKVGVPRTLPGFANTGELVILKNSPSSFAFHRSVMEISFATAMFRTLTPGPVTVPGPSVPIVPNTGAATAEVLNH